MRLPLGATKPPLGMGAASGGLRMGEGLERFSIGRLNCNRNLQVRKPILLAGTAIRNSIRRLPYRQELMGMSTLRSTWGAYVIIGCLDKSELLLGSDMQECQNSSQREHDVRT
jgi:hypothetical protein